MSETFTVSCRLHILSVSLSKILHAFLLFETYVNSRANPGFLVGGSIEPYKELRNAGESEMPWTVKSLITSIQTIALTLTMFQLKVRFDQFLNISNRVTVPKAT